MWNEHPDLLLWLLYIGGAFATVGTVRSDYVALIQSNNAVRFKHLYRSWPELLAILEQFIWSEKAFMADFKGLWKETLT